MTATCPFRVLAADGAQLQHHTRRPQMLQSMHEERSCCCFVACSTDCHKATKTHAAASNSKLTTASINAPDASADKIRQWHLISSRATETAFEAASEHTCSAKSAAKLGRKCSTEIDSTIAHATSRDDECSQWRRSRPKRIFWPRTHLWAAFVARIRNVVIWKRYFSVAM